MHSTEGPATTTTDVTTSTKTSSSSDDTKKTVMGSIGQQDIQDTTSSVSSGDHSLKRESEMEHAVEESLPAMEPLYPSGQSSRQDPGFNTKESDRSTIMMQRQQGIHLRHGSIDSAYPEFTPNIISSTYPSQLRRRLQVSLSWPTEKFREARPPLMKFQHGYQGHEPKEAKLEENNNKQMAAAAMVRHVRHVELPQMERPPHMEASSPTQEISQILRNTGLRSPPPTDIDVPRRFSFDEHCQHRTFGGHQVARDHTPTCTLPYTVTDPAIHFHGPHTYRIESSVSGHEREKPPRRLSFDEQFQHISSTHRQGELIPQLGSMQYPTTCSGHPLQNPPGDRLDSSAPSREGENLSWHAAVRPRTYPYQLNRIGAVGTSHLRSVGKFCSFFQTKFYVSYII